MTPSPKPAAHTPKKGPLYELARDWLALLSDDRFIWTDSARNHFVEMARAAIAKAEGK